MDSVRAIYKSMGSKMIPQRSNVELLTVNTAVGAGNVIAGNANTVGVYGNITGGNMGHGVAVNFAPGGSTIVLSNPGQTLNYNFGGYVVCNSSAISNTLTS